ncbi:protein DGCR6-like isoform X3 [Callithrix jacchus]
MDRYAGFLEEVADDTRQQERHYQLLSALQSLVKELPNSFQQLLSYTRLSDLALALLDGTVFKIVPGVLEIQHLIEKSLYNQRLRLQSEHRGMEHQIREEQWAMDRKIVLELDRKVADQQSTLEKAGVAGFYVTTNPQPCLTAFTLPGTTRNTNPSLMSSRQCLANVEMAACLLSRTCTYSFLSKSSGTNPYAGHYSDLGPSLHHLPS